MEKFLKKTCPVCKQDFGCEYDEVDEVDAIKFLEDYYDRHVAKCGRLS